MHLGTLFIASTIQYSTVNKQQLPEFERGAAFIVKYQVETSENENQFQRFCPFATLPDINIDGVHASLLESNQKPSRMQNLVAKAGCNNITFIGSHVPVTQQTEKMYKYVEQQIKEAHLELNTFSVLWNLSSH